MENTKKSFFSKPLVVVLTALFCCLLWGSATPAIKIGSSLMIPEANAGSSILFAGIRFTAAGILTIVIYSIARRKILLPKRKNIGKILLVSVFQTVLQYMFFYIGLSNTSGVKGTVISGCSAFFALLISALIFRTEKLTVKKVIACIIGFGGIIVINLKGLNFNMNFTGDCFVLFSAIASAMSSILMKRFSGDEDPVIISGYQFTVGGIALLGLGFALGGKVVINDAPSFALATYLALLSAIAYALWSYLLKNNPISKVTIYSFTIPPFGVILSFIFLRSEDNNVSVLNLILGLLLVSAGILLLNIALPKLFGKKKSSAENTTPPSLPADEPEAVNNSENE